jgi:molybdopterin-guanine dinucleotide biosynthesis protein A
MGQDKAVLQYRGRAQLDRAYDALSRHCERVFISMRPEQASDATRNRYPAIYDTLENAGPIAGIAAAQATHPGHAWLVVACDLPFLTDDSLRFLIAARDGRPVVAYRSTHDGLPEPLCAIYEPETRPEILAFVASGRNCPRKFVMSTGVALLEQQDPSTLENINTPEELERARRALTVTGMP